MYWNKKLFDLKRVPRRKTEIQESQNSLVKKKIINDIYKVNKKDFDSGLRYGQK